MAIKKINSRRAPFWKAQNSNWKKCLANIHKTVIFLEFFKFENKIVQKQAFDQKPFSFKHQITFHINFQASLMKPKKCLSSIFSFLKTIVVFVFFQNCMIEIHHSAYLGINNTNWTFSHGGLEVEHPLGIQLKAGHYCLGGLKPAWGIYMVP